MDPTLSSLRQLAKLQAERMAAFITVDPLRSKSHLAMLSQTLATIFANSSSLMPSEKATLVLIRAAIRHLSDIDFQSERAIALVRHVADVFGTKMEVAEQQISALLQMASGSHQ